MTRPEPALGGGERELLEGYLDVQRAIVADKVVGLTAQQLAATHPPTSLTLAGLLLHLALVEESWVVERFAGQAMPEPFDAVDFDADPDWEFRTARGQDPEVLVARYQLAVERARAVIAAAADLDQPSAVTVRGGQYFNLRWVLLHLIEETARHAGHMDLLREAIDGQTGE